MSKIPESEKFPQIVSENGLLSPEQSRQVTEKFIQDTQTGPFLKRYFGIMDTFTKKPLTTGNWVSLLVDNAAVYAAMFNAVENAKKNINVETFFIYDDLFGRRFADLLIQKRSQGVEVNLIYDRIGSQAAPRDFFQRMRDAGINVVEFSRVMPPWQSDRGLRLRFDHRKILVVDGHLAITGGTNISEGFFIDVDDAEDGGKKVIPWRDTDVQIEGPAVAQLQSLFLDNWKKQNGPALSANDYFPELKKEGDSIAQIIASYPGEYQRLTFVMYMSAITSARQSIHLTQAYFIPDKQIINALTSAARRGVEVKIVLSHTSDFASTVKGGHYSYTTLLKAGVKIYERQDAVLHSKTAVVDGIWSTVGSTNMDNWSFLSNDEVNTVVIDHSFAQEMEKLFENDLIHSEEIKLDTWQKRPFQTKLNEWLTHLFIYWL